MWRLILSVIFFSLAIVQQSCEGSASSIDSPGAGAPYIDYDTDLDDDDDGSGVIPPSDSEKSFLKSSPKALDNFVFTVNYDLDSISRIDFSGYRDGTSSIETVSVGRAPSELALCSPTPAAPCRVKRAATLNRGADTISIVDFDAEAEKNRSVELDVRPGLNSLLTSPGGRYVFAYYDDEKQQSIDDNYGRNPSGNDISLVNMAGRKVASWTGGLGLSEIEFTPDGSAAVIASFSRLTIFDLSGSIDDVNPRTILIGDNFDRIVKPGDLEISTDGKTAYLLPTGEKALYLVNIENEDYGVIDLEAIPSDLDISGDGAGVILMPGNTTSTFAFLGADPLNPQIEKTLTIDFYVNRITIAGNRAILYSNNPSRPVSRIAFINLQTRKALSPMVVVKPILQVFAAPDNRSCLIVHSDIPGNEAITLPSHNQNDVVTVMNVATPSDFNPITFNRMPASFIFSDTGDYAFALGRLDKNMVAFDLRRLLQDDVLFDTEPVYLGVLPGANLAYVSQKHSLGRISLIDPDDEMKKVTITGFILNAGGTISAREGGIR